MPVKLTTSEYERITSRKSARRAKRQLAPMPPMEDFIRETERVGIVDDGWTRIFLPYPPLLNHAYGYNVIHSHGKQFVKPYLKPEGKRYQKFVANIGMMVFAKPILGLVQLWIVSHRPANRGDIDGVFKILFDSLPGVVYENDNQIDDLLTNRRIDRLFPRVVVGVRLKAGQTLNLF